MNANYTRDTSDFSTLRETIKRERVNRASDKSPFILSTQEFRKQALERKKINVREDCRRRSFI